MHEIIKIQHYKYWYLHGEMWEKIARVKTKQDMDTDRMVDIVMDATDLEFNWDVEDDLETDSDDLTFENPKMTRAKETIIHSKLKE